MTQLQTAEWRVIWRRPHWSPGVTTATIHPTRSSALRRMKRLRAQYDDLQVLVLHRRAVGPWEFADDSGGLEVGGPPA